MFNPSHLWLGTNKENVGDSVAKGRRATIHGERNPNVKLSLKEITKIKDLYSSGKYTYRELAIKFNVSHVHIGYIILDKGWKEVM